MRHRISRDAGKHRGTADEKEDLGYVRADI